MKTYEFENIAGEMQRIAFVKNAYMSNDSLAIECIYLHDGDEFNGYAPYWETYGSVTVNLGFSYGNRGYLDTNNCGHLIKWMLKEGLVTDTGMSMRSGYCEYPLGEFTDEFLADCITYEELEGLEE